MPTTVQIAGVDGPIDVRVDDSHCTLDGTMQVGIVDLSAEMTRYVVVATHIGDSDLIEQGLLVPLDGWKEARLSGAQVRAYADGTPPPVGLRAVGG